MKFEFSTARRIVFGPGAAEQIPSLVAGYGTRAFVVLGSTSDRSQPTLDALTSREITVAVFNVAGEPTIEMAQAAVKAVREAQAEVVVAIGGGSVLDVGKVAAVMLNNKGDLSDYLEVVGKGKPLREQAIPLIAAPTTAGTGAEVTYNAVLEIPEQQVKVSMRSPLMVPRWAIVDPLLTYSMSPELTASTGLDALTQLIEAYVSNKASPVTDGVCREGLERAARSLLPAVEDGRNARAREDMAVASLLGGVALANAGLGAVHGFAGPLGGSTSAPHGVICGKLLPYVMQVNVRALENRPPAGKAEDSADPSVSGEDAESILAKFDEIGRILTGKHTAGASDGIAWITELCTNFGLPGLRKFGLSTADFPDIVQKARKASSMQGNPVELSEEELADILTWAIE